MWYPISELIKNMQQKKSAKRSLKDWAWIPFYSNFQKIIKHYGIGSLNRFEAFWVNLNEIARLISPAKFSFIIKTFNFKLLFTDGQESHSRKYQHQVGPRHEKR